ALAGQARQRRGLFAATHRCKRSAVGRESQAVQRVGKPLESGALGARGRVPELDRLVFPASGQGLAVVAVIRTGHRAGVSFEGVAAPVLERLPEVDFALLVAVAADTHEDLPI